LRQKGCCDREESFSLKSAPPEELLGEVTNECLHVHRVSTRAPPSLTMSMQKPSGDDGFFVGGKLSLPDVQFFSTLEYFDDQAKVSAALAAHPKLAKIIAHVSAIPALVAYQKSRPVTPF
jgi:hypothetical protein